MEEVAIATMPGVRLYQSQHTTDEIEVLLTHPLASKLHRRT